MRIKHTDYVPTEPDWGQPNYKDIIRHQRTFTESLPYPQITYPDVYETWLFFQELPDSAPFFCTCQKRPMVNFLRMNEAGGPYRLCRGDSLMRHFLPQELVRQVPFVASPTELETVDVFRDGLCHRCLLKVPSVRWSNHPSHSAFLQHFGWYWKQALLAYGIDWYMPLLEDQCPDDIKSLFDINPWEAHASVRAYSNEHHLNIYAFDRPPGGIDTSRPGMNQMYAVSQQLRAVRTAVESEVEKRLREHFGFPPRGRTLNHETVLFLIARAIFAPATVVRHARPNFLGGLTLDIFVPDLGVAIEYQGFQHFESADHLGGDAHFRLTKSRDSRKATLCRENQIDLIYFDVSDKLTEEYVRFKISQQRAAGYGSHARRT